MFTVNVEMFIVAQTFLVETSEAERERERIKQMKEAERDEERETERERIKVGEIEIEGKRALTRFAPFIASMAYFNQIFNTVGRGLLSCAMSIKILNYLGYVHSSLSL